ncbi:rCG32218, isoform CRA_b [Rattus norvegicus]|nr:rCG32218, isoform CRA_b [Rattus norvegicus]
MPVLVYSCFQVPLGTQNSSLVLLPPPQGWAWFKGMQDAKKSQLWLGRSGLVYTATEIETFGLLSVEIKI